MSQKSKISGGECLYFTNTTISNINKIENKGGFIVSGTYKGEGSGGSAIATISGGAVDNVSIQSSNKDI